MPRSGTGIWVKGVMGKHGEIAGPGCWTSHSQAYIPRNIPSVRFFYPNACTETERRIVFRAPTQRVSGGGGEAPTDGYQEVLVHTGVAMRNARRTVAAKDGAACARNLSPTATRTDWRVRVVF